jgi:hypothetical protein
MNDNTAEVPCPECKGRGWIHHPDSSIDIDNILPDRVPCKHCNGTGTVRRKAVARETVTVVMLFGKMYQLGEHFDGRMALTPVEQHEGWDVMGELSDGLRPQFTCRTCGREEVYRSPWCPAGKTMLINLPIHQTQNERLKEINRDLYGDKG